jgi:hypothetical protein
MTPGLNAKFAMAPMDGVQWARVCVCMLLVYGIVEMEKALVDPLLMPLIKPVLRWCEARTPACLSVDVPLSARFARMCGGKQLAHTKSFSTQARGKLRRGGKAAKQEEKQQEEVAAVPEGGNNGPAEGGQGARVLRPIQLSAVVERGHDQH